MYPNRQTFSSLLPFFAGLLIGFGIIVWIAANWEELNQWVRLGSIASMVLVFYALGDALMRRENMPAGLGFIGLGVVSFGAGFIALAQTFQLGSQSVLPFILWFIVALTMAMLLRSRALYLLSFFISFSMLPFWDRDQLLWMCVSLLLFAGGNLWFLSRYGEKWMWWLYAFGLLPFTLTFFYTTGLDEYGSYWVLTIFLGYYFVSTLFKDFILRLPFRLIGLYATFIVAIARAVLVTLAIFNLLSGDPFPIVVFYHIRGKKKQENCF
jgi:uncharacterized membrane protein